MRSPLGERRELSGILNQSGVPRQFAWYELDDLECRTTAEFVRQAELSSRTEPESGIVGRITQHDSPAEPGLGARVQSGPNQLRADALRPLGAATATGPIPAPTAPDATATGLTAT